MNLFINGSEVIKVEDNKYYYIEDGIYGVLKQVDRSEFIEQLKRLSWVCLTTWSKELRQQYLDLVEYVKEECE